MTHKKYYGYKKPHEHYEVPCNWCDEKEIKYQKQVWY